jgi:hypothetical protein
MAYTVHEADIYLFDIHTTIKPLLVPKAVQDQLSFLVDPKRYQEQYKAEQVVKTDTFCIRPLTKRVFVRDHFWHYYKEIWLDEDVPNYWKLQTPFLYDPIKTQVKLAAEELDFHTEVQRFIYLSAIGWATNLQINIKGDIDPGDQLVQFVGQLLDRDTTLFRLEGQEMNLSGIFKAISDQLRKDVYKPNYLPVDKLKIARHCVLSLTQATGSVRHYDRDDEWLTGEDTMADTDRALMHSLLYGRSISVQEFAEREQKKEYIVTKFGYGSSEFALTDFRRGTLLFMQDSANISSRRASLRCLASNIRRCSIMTLLLPHFYDESARYAKENTMIANLRESIKTTLKELPSYYTNKFCRALYTKERLYELAAKSK